MKNFLTCIISSFFLLLTLSSIAISERSEPIKCEKLGKTQCGGTCTSHYGGEGKCIWSSDSTGCLCSPIEEPSLKCNCPSRARPNLLCDSDSPCDSCIGNCYKGQAEDSECYCSSDCTKLDPKTGMYYFFDCDCKVGKCAKKTKSDILSQTNKSDF